MRLQRGRRVTALSLVLSSSTRAAAQGEHAEVRLLRKDVYIVTSGLLASLLRPRASIC